MSEFNFMPSSLGEEVIIRVRRRRTDDLLDNSGGSSNWIVWFFILMFMLWMFTDKVPNEPKSTSSPATPTATVQKGNRF